LADVGFKDSIRIRVYNAAHREIAVTSYEMARPDKRKYSELMAALEINGEVVLFIATDEEKTHTVYRVIVDPNSGQVNKEEKILSLKPLPKNEMYALWWGNLSISKAADSDDYAIVFCNDFQSDKIKEIGVLLFNKEHVETGRSFYQTAEKEFSALRLCNIRVIDHEKVSLLLIGSTWDDKRGDEGRKMFLALMKKGSSSLSITKLNLPEDNVPIEPQLYYNNYSKKLIVAAVCGGKKVDQYLCFLDPETGKAAKIISYDFNDVFYEKGKDIYGRKYVFYGMPANFFVEKNGDFSIVYEEKGSEITGGGSHDYISDIIVADFDKNGKLLNNYLVPRKVFINTNGGFANNYIEFAYVKNNDKAYLFFNDFRENIERLQNNKNPKQVVVVHDCDAFYFSLTGKEPMPSRKYLFRETDEKEEHIQSPFGVFVYDKENDLFITLRLNRDEKKRKKTVNVVWLKPQ
ncbi:MAG: hypothetical protein ABIN74_13560, partial [Ferruginibacter sp.]